MKRSPFKKASSLSNGSSSASIISSAISVTDEISEINEENVIDYNTDSFEETASAEILSSSASRNENSSRTLTKHNSAETKSISLKMGSNSCSNSNSNSSRINIASLPVKRSVETKQHISKSAIQGNQYESSSRSGSRSETLSSSTTRTSKSHKSYNYEAKKHGEKNELQYSEENQKHTNSSNVGFSKRNSRSIKKYQSKSSCSADSQSSRRSNILDKRSYKVKKQPSLIDMNNFSSIECCTDDLEKSEQSDTLSNHMLADFDNDNYSRKVELDGKKGVNNVGVQTIHSEPERDLSPVFTPLLLRDIEESMKRMSEKEAISSVIQTHVELIKRQSRREKRMLEEWDSAISDLEERCKLVSFERLKLLLHGNNYSHAS
uniref:Suppressor protein SRP40-like n=1 Tax=Elaeophora elaphi TaxID=1147741 RepID=A0A0R3RSP1_9BILA